MANAKVSFMEVTSEQLSSLPITDGMITFDTNTRKLYKDTATERLPISTGTQIVASVTEPIGLTTSDIWVVLED